MCVCACVCMHICVNVCASIYICVCMHMCHTYFSKLLELRFLAHSTLHSLILLNSEAKIFNTIFYSLIFLSC